MIQNSKGMISAKLLEESTLSSVKADLLLDKACQYFSFRPRRKELIHGLKVADEFMSVCRKFLQLHLFGLSLKPINSHLVKQLRGLE